MKKTKMKKRRVVLFRAALRREDHNAPPVQGHLAIFVGEESRLRSVR